MSQIIQLNNINTGNHLAIKITPIMDYEFNTRYLKAYATNNGLDENIVWEDITNALLNKEDYYFKNKTKTSDNGAISMKVELDYSDNIEINVGNSNSFSFNNIEVMFDNNCIYSLKELIKNKSFILSSVSGSEECEIDLNCTNEVVENG